MIITLRGTSGSGKTTLVRQWLDGKNLQPIFIANRKNPIAYLVDGHTIVLGHYNQGTQCSGADTIHTYEGVYALVRQYHSAGYHGLSESYLLSADTWRILELYRDGLPYIVIRLTTDLDQCINHINFRRKAKNPDKMDVDPKHTVAKHKAIISSVGKLTAAGVDTREYNYEEALECLNLNLR